MRKIFLISLLALFTCATAWAKDAHVSTIADLNAKLADASIETIYLDADLTYASEACINILRSVTLDGQGHIIKGGGIRTGSTKSTLAINQGAPSNENWIDLVTLKNLTLQNAISAGQALNVRCNLTKLVIENCTIKTTGSGNNQPITFGGNQETPVDVTINDSYISSGQAGYPLITFNPIALKTKNTTYKGYCALYFKGPNSSAGTGGSTVDADNCDFDAPNMNAPAGGWNSFGVFAIEDGGITFNLNNCGFNSQEIGSDQQQVFLFSSAISSISSLDPCVVRITGDNSHINGHMLRDAQSSIRAWLKENYDPNSWDHVIEIAGGTYAEDPSQVTSGDLAITIAEGYEVKEVAYQDAGTSVTLYRITKKAATKEVEDPDTGETVEVLYDLNDLVEGEGVEEGNNPVSSFELSTGEEMTLNQETTTAGYVQVQDNVTVNPDTQEEVVTPTTVQVGKTEVNPETEEKEKVDQTLVINNGLDVQGDSKVEVQAGSALVIGEGGINTEKPENIVIEADEQGAASLLLEPSITVNQTPQLTVKMTVPAEHAGYEMYGGNKYRHWFRFAVPVKDGDSWTKEPNVPTYLYGWDYNEQEWAQVSVAEMIPFYGYTLSPDQEIDRTTAVTYTFKGKLMGNTDCKLELNHHGYNFFGNSYTGYISILKLVEQIMGDAKIDGTVWMWDGEKYQGVALAGLSERPFLYESWQKEVAPMQTFVLRLTGAEFSSTDINYADAIWGNPRYTSAVANAAPARKAEMNDNAIIRMTIAANGQKESVLFIENNDYSDEYDRGYDAIKYMNGNSFNSYVSVNGENYGTVATDNIEGKMLDIRTSDAYAYSMTFDFVAGEEYALLDNATNQVIEIEEGNTYEFAAQPNSTVEGRFEIISRAKMPTAIENTEVKADVKGIYTIMGQYLGENFEALPAGVYVVNGVKIVK